MLATGRDRLYDAGVAGNVDYVQADAEALPFKPASFHCITIGFGLRNVTDQNRALASMYSVLKPGGRVLVLEFSKAHLGALERLFTIFIRSRYCRDSAQWLADDAASYRYLAESIRRHPDQEALKVMLERQGFERCEYYNLAAGIVALHVGYRL